MRKGPSKEEAWQLQVLRKGLSAIGRNGKRVGFPQGGDTLGGNWWKDNLDVALPKIKTQVGGVFTDTVFIRSDSMKVRDSLVVSLTFLRDSNNASLSVNDKVDSAGYKYKSRWIGSEDVQNARVRPDTFWRQFPADSLVYRRWNRITANCAVGFNKDSLYVVGGKLTIESKGALKHIPNINNMFKVNTDTLATNGTDTLRTKRILIDRDPPNAAFLDSLHYDIIKAIAWVEYAGSSDQRHCHEHRQGGVYYNPQYNDYWDDFINSLGVRCRDTKTPCENTQSSATGTMQMLRFYWAPAFRRADYIPPGYYRAEWDSLAWNWKINVFNGNYIYFKDNFYQMTSDQKTWDSVCVQCSPADSLPLYKNKEDLSSYGYNQGAPQMRLITKANWLTIMKGTSDGAKYVRDVRGSKYAHPWR